MFENGIKKFMEIENSHFKKEQRQRRYDQLKIESYKNLY